MKKILVTGVGGYVGVTLCEKLLLDGYQVRGVDNFHKGNCDSLIRFCTNPNFEFMYGDVSNKSHISKMINGVDGIIHLAAIVGFPACAKSPGLSKLVNVEGTRNIVNAKPKDVKLIFASTGSVYGKLEDRCTENSPTNPQSEYGIDKLEAEKIVLDSENTLAYRFATGYGVSPCMRVNLLVNDLVYQAYSNKSLVIFQADFRRTFIHVKDMANIFEWGLRTKTSHTLYNAGSASSNWTKRELAEFIKTKTNCLVTYAEVGEDLDKRDYEVDYSRLKSDGWEPQYSMGYGIEELIKVAPLLQMRNPYA